MEKGKSLIKEIEKVVLKTKVAKERKAQEIEEITNSLLEGMNKVPENQFVEIQVEGEENVIRIGRNYLAVSNISNSSNHYFSIMVETKYNDIMKENIAYKITAAEKEEKFDITKIVIVWTKAIKAIDGGERDKVRIKQIKRE